MRGGARACEGAEVLCRDAGPRGHALWRILGCACTQLLPAQGVLLHVGAVFELLRKDDVHHAQHQGRVRAGVNGQVPVCQARGAGLVGIDDDQPGTVAAGLLYLRPQVDGIAVDICAPGDDQARAMELLRIRAQLAPVDREQRVAARGGADGAVQLRGAQPVEEAAIHGAVVEHAHGAGIGVGQDGLRPVLLRDFCETAGDQVQGLVPGDGLEVLRLTAGRQRSLGQTRLAAHGLQQAVWRVHPVQILRHFAAQEATGDGMVRVAGHTLGSPRAIHADQHGAGVRAVMRTDCVHHTQGRWTRASHTTLYAAQRAQNSKSLCSHGWQSA